MDMQHVNYPSVDYNQENGSDDDEGVDGINEESKISEQDEIADILASQRIDPENHLVEPNSPDTNWWDVVEAKSSNLIDEFGSPRLVIPRPRHPKVLALLDSRAYFLNIRLNA